jgi:hypothetical protein
MLTSEDVRRVAEFIRQRLREPNAETAAAIEAAGRGDTVVVGDADGLFADLNRMIRDDIRLGLPIENGADAHGVVRD